MNEEQVAAHVRRKLAGEEVFNSQTMAVLVALAKRALNARRRLRSASASGRKDLALLSVECGEAWNALQHAKRAALDYGEEP